jgi:ribosomal protein S6--L-glutamate ligase
LAAVIESRGNKVDVINTTRCYVDISPQHPAIHYQGHLLPRFDAVIPRIGPSITFYGVALLRHFESLGTFCINGSTAIAQSRDRLLAHQLLGRSGIAMPVTTFAHYPGDTKDMIKLLGGAPLVIKLLSGAEGKSVVLAETNKAAEAVIHAFRGLNANFIAQEYINEPSSKDIRCIVLGNKIIASIQRIETDEEFSDRPARIKSRTIKITLAEKHMAIRAARILGLKFAAVNLLRTKDGPKIIDVNSSPGLRRFETATGIDIAALVVEFMENHARPRLPKRMIGFK